MSRPVAFNTASRTNIRLEPEAHLDELERTRELCDLVIPSRAPTLTKSGLRRAPRHELLGLEMAQRGADGGARCRKGHGKLALRRELLTGRIASRRGSLCRS